MSGLSTTWKKSSRSGAAGHCVEARWKKSTHSVSNGACAEVRSEGDRILVRDTKDAGAGPTLSFTQDEWLAFVGGVKDGEFDLA